MAHFQDVERPKPQDSNRHFNPLLQPFPGQKYTKLKDFSVRRLQRWAWERVSRGTLLLRCRLLGGAKRFGALGGGDGRGHTAAAAHLQLVSGC